MKDTRKRQPYGAKSGTCADCKAIIWRGTGSLPPGAAKCRDCRRLKRDDEPRPTHCVYCREPFESTWTTGRAWRKTCSDKCLMGCARAGIRAPRGATQVFLERTVPCRECQSAVTTRCRSAVLCADCREDKARAHWRRKNAQRRGAEVSGPTLSLQQLGGRDGWRCHLCLKRVSSARKFPDPLCGTFDHLVPIADGGDDALENLRLAHFRCNSSRGKRGVVQLLLVG